MEYFFASCPRGLESLLEEDIERSGGCVRQSIAGGIGFSGEWESCYRLNLLSSVATRVLWKIAEAPYRTENDIYELARRQPWPEWFSLHETFRVYLTATHSPLKSLEFSTLRVKDAVCDVFRGACRGERPSVDTRSPQVRIHAFLTAEQATLYLDTSGEPLWARGLRAKTVEAPLKENLAAGILRLSGWQPGTPLIDPMCGSGTFLLEAALRVKNIAPGLKRARSPDVADHFGFTRLKNFDQPLWQQVLSEAESLVQPSSGFPDLYARDSDPRAVRATLANLDRAGFAGLVDLRQGEFLDEVAPADHGVLVANPPYGERLSEQEALAAFYPAMGAVLKKNYAGWTCCFLTADLSLPKQIRLKPSRKTPLFNGPLECRLFRFEMVAGSNRREKVPHE